MNKARILVATTIAALALAALVITPYATAHSRTAGRVAATTVKVKGGEFFFKLSTSALAAPGAVTFTFTNIGHVAHNFTINGKQTPLIDPGKTANLAVTFKKKGAYPYLCTVPGHAAAGMKGTFTVR
jgi:uncharacterized cupredoxin-like copper-binding protein